MGVTDIGQETLRIRADFFFSKDVVFYFFILLYFLRFNFIYFWLCWVFVAAHRLSLVKQGLLLLRSTGSRCAGSVVVMHGLSFSAACGIF